MVASVKKLIFLVLLIGIILVVYLSQYLPKIIPSDNQTSISDPSVVYCEGLGYKINVKTNYTGKYGGGEYAVCILPNGNECIAWDFFNGKCGQKYTYCEQHGGKINITNKSCVFTPECAVCTLSNGIVCYEWDNFKGKCLR